MEYTIRKKVHKGMVMVIFSDKLSNSYMFGYRITPKRRLYKFSICLCKPFRFDPKRLGEIIEETKQLLFK